MNMAAVLLFWDTYVPDVTSCENALCAKLVFKLVSNYS